MTFVKTKHVKMAIEMFARNVITSKKRKKYNPKANKKKYQANKDKILSDRKKYYIKNRKTA